MRNTAVVVGASMAGLATAAALADRFARVVLLDRDELPDRAEPRRGVPQGRHGHVLLVAGLRALEEMFPGLHDELLAAGAIAFDIGTHLSVYRFGTVWAPMPTGLDIVSLSRPLLELTVRRRVAALPGVMIRDRCAVQRLTSAGDRVTGVVLEGGETVAADLVVDCSGRGSRSGRWLAELGYPAPETLEVKVGVGYGTRLYRREPGRGLGGAAGAFVLPTAPAENRVGLVLPIEGDRWLVSLGGWHLDDLPADEDSFRRDAAALPHPDVADLIAHAEPLTGIATMRFPSSRRRRFERLRRLPGGYVALGDAVCSFNPVYGQGMTCAVLQAQALASTLDRHSLPSAAMSSDFYRAAATVITTPWRFAVGGDFMYPRTTGPRPPGIALFNRYARRVQLAARVSADVRRTFVSVQQLVTPPSVLFRPSMVARVLAKGWSPS